MIASSAVAVACNAASGSRFDVSVSQECASGDEWLVRCQTDAGSVSMRLSRANAAHLARMILSSLTVREPFDMDQP